MQLPASRLAATALATAALTLGGLTAGAGTAQAATTVQCASAFSLDEGFTGFIAQGCNAYTPDGGPYTVTVATFADEWISSPGGGVTTFPYTNVNLTCQTFVADVNTLGWSSGSTCVANSFA